MAPAALASQAKPMASTVTRMCTVTLGVTAWLNFPVDVTLQNGRISAVTPHTPYITGVFIGGVQGGSDHESYQVTNDGKAVQYRGDAVVDIGIPNTPISVHGPFTCAALYTF
jgi:hypothetical protein